MNNIYEISLTELNKKIFFYSEEELLEDMKIWLNTFPSPLKFYQILILMYKNHKIKIFEYMKEQEELIRRKILINNQMNNKYEELLYQSIKDGNVNIYQILIKIKGIIKDKEYLKTLLQLAINHQKEQIAIYIYKTEKLKFKDKYNILKICLQKDLIELFKIIYEKEIKKDEDKIEEIYKIIGYKQNLELIKFLYNKNKNIFLNNYTEILIESIKQSNFKIFKYFVEILNIKEVSEEEKETVLEIALLGKKETFEKIIEIIEPDLIFLKKRKILLKEAKSRNIYIYKYLKEELGI